MVKPIVDPGKKLSAALKKAGAKVADLTVPLQLISQQWFKSNNAIFTLKSQGKYVDLSELYKPRKQAAVGFIYPILKRKGLLSASITDPAHPNAISFIINRKSLTLGTNVDYANFLDKGTSKMPARSVVLFGNEQVAPDALAGRVRQWESMILDYCAQVSGAV